MSKLILAAMGTIVGTIIALLMFIGVAALALAWGVSDYCITYTDGRQEGTMCQQEASHAE